MGCAEHCPSFSQGCTRTCSSTPLTPIHLHCQQTVMNVIVNAPTTIVINRNNTYSGNGNGPAAAAANGGLIPLPILQQLQQPMVQNRFPLSSPLSIRRRAGDVAGTSREKAAPPPRNGPNEQASIYPVSNLELSLEANSTYYSEEHPFLCRRLESLNLERLRPIDETRLASDDEEDDKIRYPNLIHFF
ncbi:uncharacterized protein LOC142182531 [Nicotiana tabacum]|uniref:Uncharacterized protein LOC142182531 n=1 Tax=Nicotiana tabacum TaxID=4097 RepID=A0AC58UTN5_TOBAC